MAAIRHILAIINAHGEVQTAARRAAQLAQQLNARLTLQAVVYEPDAAFDLFHILDRDHVRHQFVGAARTKLDEVVQQLGLDAANTQCDVHWLHPFDSGALHGIHQHDPDLVVIAPRDQRGQRLSHAEWRLIHACPAPVLLARARAWAEPAVIAACVDPGHHGDDDATVDQRVLDYAIALHGTAGQVELLHALGEIPDAIAVAQNPAEYQQGLEASRRSKIRQLVPESLRDELNVQIMVGDPDWAIEKFCTQRPVDLLVMGVFSRSSLVDYLIGGTARRTLPGLPCDVLAIPAALEKNRQEDDT